jgi:hypothetical protein
MSQTLTRYPERLSIGKLTTTDDTSVLLVPRQTRYLLSAASFTNTTNEKITISVHAKAGGVNYPLAPTEMELEAGAQLLIESPMALEANEELYAQASLKNAVVYFITGTKIPAIPSASDRAQ